MAELPETIPFDPRQVRFWWKAAMFFDWCHHRLRKVVEELDDKDRKEFEEGGVPQALLKIVYDEHVEHLKVLPMLERFEVIRSTLQDPADFDAWMKSPSGDQSGLPNRITDAVNAATLAACRRRSEEFFAEVDRSQMVKYLHVWQSKEDADHRLILLARREITLDDLGKEPTKVKGLSFGRIRIDRKRWLFRGIATNGNLGSRGVPQMISLLAADNDHDFFIKLGKQLDKIRRTKTREPEIVWEDVHDMAQYLVRHWCGYQFNPHLPPLCLYQNKALVQYCEFAMDRPDLNRKEGPQNVRKWISRLGLARANAPKVDISITPASISFRKVSVTGESHK
jgi:hypothetical protein